MDKYDLVEKYQLELMKQVNYLIEENVKRKTFDGRNNGEITLLF